MRLERRNRPLKNALGLYVTLTTTKSNLCCIESSGPAYRQYVTIALPESQHGEWEKYFIHAIKTIENGQQWSVRLNWNNVTQFFSMDNIASIDSHFKTISFYIYGLPKEYMNCSLDVDALYNAKLRAKYRQRKGRCEI